VLNVPRYRSYREPSSLLFTIGSLIITIVSLLFTSGSHVITITGLLLTFASLDVTVASLHIPSASPLLPTVALPRNRSLTRLIVTSEAPSCRRSRPRRNCGRQEPPPPWPASRAFAILNLALCLVRAHTSKHPLPEALPSASFHNS